MPVLLSVEDARRIMRGQADDTTDADLLLFLEATDEVVEEIAGPLTEPIPQRWRLAGRIIFEHLWDHWQGAVPTQYEGGTDESLVPTGFAIPRAAQELLLVPKRAAARAPQFSFPEPSYVWPSW
jgi:hypothetical protein